MKILLLISAVCLSSCANYNTASKNNAGTGALLGAAAGAIIGNNTDGDAKKGAAIGAGIGALSGYGASSITNN